MAIDGSTPAARVARFFFMHLGGLVAIITYFWIYGATGYTPEGLRTALVTALIVHTSYWALARSQGEHKQFDLGLWLMFAIGNVAAYVGPDVIFQLYRLYSPAILFATLGVTAVIPLLLGRETFTNYYARRQVPRWQLKTPEFAALDRVMTAYWAILLFTAAAFCAYSPLDPRFTFLIPNFIVLGLGMTAQWWLPALYFKIFPPGLPRSSEPLIMGMPMVFNGTAAQGARACIQFHVSGPEPGAYWVRIADGKCESFEGVTDKPDLTVRTPDDIWVRIAHRQLDGGQALAEGLYQAEGDFLLLARMGEWFAGTR